MAANRTITDFFNSADQGEEKKESKRKIQDDLSTNKPPQKKRAPVSVKNFTWPSNDNIDAAYFTGDSSEEKDLTYLHFITPEEWVYYFRNLENESVINREDPCVRYTRGTRGPSERPCITMPKEHSNNLKSRCPNLHIPAKIPTTHVALYKVGRKLPAESPPPPPPYLLAILKLQKIGKVILNEKKFRWVASHLCNSFQPEDREDSTLDCVTASSEDDTHLCWEPDWSNRLRDNCLSVFVCENCDSSFNSLSCPNCAEDIKACSHVPPCLKPHKATFIRTPVVKKPTSTTSTTTTTTSTTTTTTN